MSLKFWSWIDPCQNFDMGALASVTKLLCVLSCILTFSFLIIILVSFIILGTCGVLYWRGGRCGVNGGGVWWYGVGIGYVSGYTDKYIIV